MVTIVVSSKGQIVLPAALRRKLGMGAGARLEVVEQPEGLTLRVARAVEIGDERLELVLAQRRVNPMDEGSVV